MLITIHNFEYVFEINFKYVVLETQLIIFD